MKTIQLVLLVKLMICGTVFAQDGSKLSDGEGQLNFLLQRANTLKSENRDSAYHYATQAVELAEEMNEAVPKIRSAIQLGNISLHWRDWDIGEGAYLKGLRVADSVGDTRGQVALLANLAVLFHDKGEIPAAKDYYERTIKAHENWDDEIKLAGTMSSYATLLNATGSYQSALHYLRLAQKTFLKNEDTLGQVSTLNRIGNSYFHLAKADSSLASYFEALELSEASGLQAGIAASSGNIANLCIRNSAFDFAEVFLEKALQANRESGYEIGYAIALNNRGEKHLLQGKMDRAEDDFNESLEIRRRTRTKEGIAESLMSLAGLYTKQGQFAKANEALLEAELLADTLQDQRKIAEVELGFGLLRHQEKQHRKAVSHFNNGLAILLRLDVTFKVRDAARGLYESHKALGNTQKALSSLEQFLHIEDSLFNATKLFQLAQIEKRYEEEKAEREKLQLLLSNETQLREIGEREEDIFRLQVLLFGIGGFLLLAIAIGFLLVRTRRMRIQNRMAELRQSALSSQMNPHFVFNALNCIQRFVLKNEMEEAYEYLEKFASLIRTVFDHSQKQSVPLADELEMLSIYIDLEKLRFEQHFSYEIEIASPIDIESENIPPMILQPLVENAIWHGLNHLPEGGKLKINIRDEKEKIGFTIQDNGVGRAAAKQFNNPNHRSSGLEKTRQRLKLINGRNYSNQDFSVVDLVNEQGKAAGTQVDLMIIRDF